MKTKITITTEKGELNSAAIIKQGTKIINWIDLSRDEQIRLLNAVASFHELFSRFIKE